jgi:large subunit ribosomal protein L32e
MRIKFLRRDWKRHGRIGKGRKRLQRWRAPKGRHNKMRDKRKGYPRVVSIGYKGKNKEEIKVIKNLKDLEMMNKNRPAIIGNVGKKKKLELAKKAKELKLNVLNLNIEKFIKKNEIKAKETKK